MAVAAGVVIVSAFVLVGAVILAGLRLTSPARAIIGPPPADLPVERVEIPSASGATVRGWFARGRPGGGAVVLMHGVRSNRLSMVRRARLLTRSGFSVLLFDFQAHGESAGRKITFGYLEALDARAAVDFVRRLLPAERIGAIGASLGGAAALLGPAPLRVDALVLEAVYPDIDAALSNRLRVALGPMVGRAAAPLVVPLFRGLMPFFLDIGPDQLRPVDRIAEQSAPVLIASGTRDDRTSIGETRACLSAPTNRSCYG